MEISVIIPTLNEERLVSQAIESAWQSGADEVVVADGGSTDSTLSIAIELDCKIIECEVGRGIQLNAGAFVATGSVLVFLHADSQLPLNGCEQIKNCFGSGHLAGAFKQRVDSHRLAFRLIEFGNSLRVRWLQMAYGDQGMFVSRELFERLGGFENIPFMEDFCFSKKLRKSNRYALLPGPLLVNARHWEKRGPFAQTVNNWMTIFQFIFGAELFDRPTSAIPETRRVLEAPRVIDKVVKR